MIDMTVRIRVEVSALINSLSHDLTTRRFSSFFAISPTVVMRARTASCELHRTFSTRTVRARVELSVGVGGRGVVPAGTGPTSL